MSSDFSPLPPDVVRQLKAARPEAPARLRQAVSELAPQPPERSLGERLRGLVLFDMPRPRLALAAPLALLLVGAVAASIVYHSNHSGNNLGGYNSNGTDTQLTNNEIPGSGASAQTRQGAPVHGAANSAKAQLAPVPAPGGRPQQVTTELTMTVKGVAALSRQTLQAMQVTRRLGGYLDSVDYSSGQQQPQPCPLAGTAQSGVNIVVPPCVYNARQGRDGVAILVLKVPVSRVQDALVELSTLGQITSQHLAVQDLKASEDQTQKDIQRLKDQIAQLRGQLASAAPTAGERQSLRAQLRQAEAQLSSLVDQQSQTKSAAAYSTLTVTLETPLHKHFHQRPIHHGQAHKALLKAKDILVWEALGVFYVIVVLGPALVLLILIWLAWRRRLRARDERLLDGEQQ